MDFEIVQGILNCQILWMKFGLCSVPNVACCQSFSQQWHTTFITLCLLLNTAYVIKTRGVHLLSRPSRSCREPQRLSGDGPWLCRGKFWFFLKEHFMLLITQHLTYWLFLSLVGWPDSPRGELHTGYLHCARWYRVCRTQRVPQGRRALHQVRDTLHDELWIMKWQNCHTTPHAKL